jgi:two-component system, OmpR family, phosphate regulon response regulator OmpR
LHLLVVDSEAQVSTVIDDMLADAGHRITIAANATDAREFLTGADRADCVILDASIELDNSATLALDMKELRLPVVLISGDPAAMAFASKHGLQLLLKPFRMAQLYDAIGQAMASGEFGQRDV